MMKQIFFKRSVILCAALVLAACGFTPMHAPAGSSSTFKTLNIGVDFAENIDVDDKEAAFWMRQALVERVGETAAPKHTLRISPTSSRGGIGISGADIATRYDLRLRTKYELVDEKGNIVTKGNVSSVSTFSAASDPYALISAEKTTTRQLADDAADRILVRIATYYANKRP
ncbi:MAG: LPS assembly lipoprotein LptE [Maricaulaceae bacterium]